MSAEAVAGECERTGDRGSAEVLGLVLFFPVMLGLAVLVVFLGRTVDARAQVQAASDAAAESAAIQRSPAAGRAAAEQTAQLMLAEGTTCSGGADVSISAGSWVAGSRVTVRVTCSPDRTDLRVVAPPARVITAVGSAMIDPHRAPELP